MFVDSKAHQDHRDIARRLDLLHFQEEAPGMVFWHPNGFVIYKALEDAVRAAQAKDRYLEVKTPQAMRRAIWERSGHWSHFGCGGMFIVSVSDGDDEGGDEGGDEGDGDAPNAARAADEVGLAAAAAVKRSAREAALKPVSCPGHVQVFGQSAPSYRSLPMRLSELGVVHRAEASGTLHGLFRLRQFTQDDGHIFCAEEDVVGEAARFCRAAVAFYQALGFDDVQVALSTRPSQRFGDEAVWDRAEAALALAAQGAGLRVVMQPGEGAFYGPKLEFGLRDRLGRAWQCGTIQLDFVMPERFDIHYIDAQGQRRRPAMLHRAMCGSLERMIGILLEHYGARLPGWLAPVQVIVAPVSQAHAAYAQRVCDEATAAGLRARLDDRSQSLPKRAAEAREGGAPWLWVVGAREEAAAQVSVRPVGGEAVTMSLADALGRCAQGAQRPQM
jgi:threonyl-tRNA synthetase